MDKCKGCVRKAFLAQRFGSGSCGYDMSGEKRCSYYLSVESCKTLAVSPGRDGRMVKANIKQLKTYAAALK